jgi:hypothetical protein
LSFIFLLNYDWSSGYYSKGLSRKDENALHSREKNQCSLDSDLGRAPMNVDAHE